MSRFFMFAGGAATTVAEQPVDGQTGVWLKSGGVTISSAMKTQGTVISAAQSQYIYSRGEARSCTVAASGHLYVSNGGIMIDGQVAGASAMADVSSGGAAAGITIQSGGRVNLWAGGSMTDVAIDATFVVYGGVASHVVHNVSTFLIQPRGSALNISSYNGTLVVASTTGKFGYASGILAAGGNVQISGFAEDITVAKRVQVFNGGTATSITVLSGGTLTVSSGGSALAVTSNAGATVTVVPGGHIEYTE